MADLIAIGYDDEMTADEAAAEVHRLEGDLIIEADAALSQYGCTVHKTSLTDEQTKNLQDALHGS